MSWGSPEALFTTMSRAGPWHAIRLRRGDKSVDELGKDFQAT